MSITSSSVKPKLSFWQIWNMSFGFLGIQFGFALQNANTSRIFETLGADTGNLALYWLAAPITGLIIQPIVGFYSDRTWHKKWGRRRPYFAIGAILASVALCLMPNSSSLWMAVGVLWIMDASINISMEPFRAFVGDMLPPSQRTSGFAMQSFFIGVGAVVASMLPWMFSNWFGLVDNTTGVHDAVKYSFYIGAFMLFVTVMWTVFSTKEYPPSDIGEEKLRNREKRKIDNESLFRAKFNRTGLVFMAIAGILALAVFQWSLEKELYVLVFGFSLFSLTHLIASMYIGQGKSYLGLVNIVKDFNTMPKTMIQLAYVQFFSWFALFAMWIYTTSAITSHMYDMNMSADQFKALLHHTDNISPSVYERLKTNKEMIIKEMSELNEKSKSNEIHMNIKVVQFFLDKDGNIGLPSAISARLKEIKDEYNAGANWTGILFGIYSGVSALAALLIPILARLTSRKVTHFISLCCGALGLISFYFIQDPIWLIASMVGIGVAWASILSVPYAMLSGSLPSEKMGYYMGVFNFFIVIPQIIAGTVLGLMLTHLFNGQSIFILVAGGVSMFISALLSLRVSDKDEVVIVEKI